jgi:hypothetical protein
MLFSQDRTESEGICLEQEERKKLEGINDDL